MKSELPDYPGVRPWTNRHGAKCWRFRRPATKTTKEVSKIIAGSPGTPEFDAVYQALILDQPIAKPTKRAPVPAGIVIECPVAWIVPRTFGDAYRLLRSSNASWRKLDKKTRANQASPIEYFLQMRVDVDDPALWRDMPVSALRRRHVEEILDTVSESYVDEKGRKLNGPWKAKAILVGLRKLLKAAMRAEWVETNVARDIEWSPPPTTGWKPWGERQIELFEKRWPIGTTPRTAFALARWLGNRRSDVALLRWDMIETRTIVVSGFRRRVTGFAFTQHKNRNRKPVEVFLPITPMLAQILAPLDRSTETVLVGGRGTPYQIGSLSHAMRDWANAAGVEKGYSLHGLRKVFGGMLDDAEVSSGQSQDAMGHAGSAVNDKYRVSRKRARNAVIAFDRVTKMVADNEAGDEERDVA